MQQKLLLICLFLITISLSGLYAQEPILFETELDDGPGTAERISHGIQTSSGNYLFCGSGTALVDGAYLSGGIVREFDPFGQVQQTAVVPTDGYWLYDKVVEVDDGYLFAGSAASDFDSPAFIFLEKRDQDLNREFLLPLADPNFRGGDVVEAFVNNGVVTLLGSRVDTTTENQQMFLYRATVNGDSLFAGHVSVDTSNYCYSYFPLGDSAFRGIGMGQSPGGIYAVNVIYDLDTNLQVSNGSMLSDYDSVPGFEYEGVTSIWQSVIRKPFVHDYLVATNSWYNWLNPPASFEEEQDHSLLFMRGDSVVKNVRLGYESSYEAFSKHGLSYIDSTAFFVGATKNQDNVGPLYNYWPTWYDVAKIDRDGNVLWNKFYGDDTRAYRLQQVIATEDGGCLLAGTVFDYSDTTEARHTHIYLLKIGADGQVVGTDEPEDLPVSQHTIYPNPSSGLVNFASESPEPFDIKLYDAVGKVAFRQENTQPYQSLDLSDLPKGLYLYRLERDGKMESGKLILQ